MSDDDNPTYNVTSLNQRGGITAGRVSIGTQPRVLTEELKQSALKVIADHPGKRFSVAAPKGDGEAITLAAKLTDFLRAEGHKIDGISQVFYTGAPKGFFVKELDADRIEFVVGHNM